MSVADLAGRESATCRAMLKIKTWPLVCVKELMPLDPVIVNGGQQSQLDLCINLIIANDTVATLSKRLSLTVVILLICINSD